MNEIVKIDSPFNINKAALIVGFFTLLSRLTGLLRDRLFASHFGAGDILDSYYAAFRIPDFIFNLLILGTLSVAFIPIFTELRITDKKQANKTANTVFNFSFLLMSSVCFILWIFAEPLSHFLVPGFAGQKFIDTLSLTRLFLLSPIIFTLSNFFGSILNSYKRFAVVGIAPILYNIGIILGLIFLYPKFGIIGLGYGVIFGACLHLIIQMPFAINLGYFWEPILDFKDQAFQKMAKLFIPKIFGLDNSQISLLIGSVIGSLLASGSIAILNLANNLQAVPLGIFAISVAVAAFPELSAKAAKKDDAGFLSALGGSIIQILFFILPITVLLLLLRAHIVRLAYGAGEFSWSNTILTFKTLGILSISLFAQSLAPLLSRVFYSRQNTIIPVIINGFTIMLNAALAFIFGKKYGVVGIAWAFSIASILNLFLMYFILKIFLAKQMAEENLRSFNIIIFKKIWGIALSTFACGFAVYGALYAAEPFLNTKTAVGLLIQAGLASLIGVLVYLFAASSMHLEQAKKILKMIKL